MKKYILWLLPVLVSAVLLSGCSCRHEWADATCEIPKTCTKCALTEGDPLMHDWQPADCTTPKTCSRCMATEGSALGHSWEEATCTTAKICSVCAFTEGTPLEHTWTGEATLYAGAVCSVCETEGDPLPGYFVQNGLTPNLTPDTAVDYVTNTNVRPDLDTAGSLTVSNLRVFDYDSTHRTKVGYEWRCADVTIFFEDNRSGLYGSNVTYTIADYYQELELKTGGKKTYFTITYQDKPYKCLVSYENILYYSADNRDVFEMTCYVQVPVGYDGVVLALCHGGTAIDGMYLHEVDAENMLMFRLA